MQWTRWKTGVGWSGVVLVALIALSMAWSFSLRMRHDDSDRLDSAADIVAKGAEDWFWWHRALPKDYRQIEPYVEGDPKEWQPLKNWSVTYRLVSGTAPDEEFGGRLSLLEVTMKDGTRLVDRRTAPIDVRDPDRLWKPHRSRLGPEAPGTGHADTEKNRMDTFAYTVFETMQECGKPSVTLTDVRQSYEGGELDGSSLLTAYTWKVVGPNFVVRDSKSGKTRAYPLAGPTAVNMNVGPLLHPDGGLSIKSRR